MAKMAIAKDSDRGLTWTHDETRALIRIWADSEIQKDFETCRRNASIYEKLVTRLRDSGFERTVSQCRTKVKSLRADYNATKTENSKSGRGRKTSAYFEEMDQVLGHRQASAPPVLIDTSISDEQDSETDSKLCHRVIK